MPSPIVWRFVWCGISGINWGVEHFFKLLDNSKTVSGCVSLGELHIYQFQFEQKAKIPSVYIIFQRPWCERHILLKDFFLAVKLNWTLSFSSIVGSKVTNSSFSCKLVVLLSIYPKPINVFGVEIWTKDTSNIIHLVVRWLPLLSLEQ